MDINKNMGEKYQMPLRQNSLFWRRALELTAGLMCVYVCVCTTAAVTASVAVASLTLPDDRPYLRYRKGRTLYIFDESARDVIPQLAAYNEALRAVYDRSFAWKLDEEQDLILLSPAQQIPNAYATVVPDIKTAWYPSGAEHLEKFAVPSWMFLLAAHETAHLYQLNAKGRLNAALAPVFGSAVAPFGIPFFIHPNLFTPSFLLEGNSVMLESRLNIGGRLHSGEKRALVLAQIQAGDINPTRLINDTFLFPYGETPYLQGGYFQAHLASKYGIDRTNRFFVAQGGHYIWPLILNKTFREHFGASYPQEIRDYVRTMEALAREQKRTPGEPILRAPFVGPMNHDEARVWFLTDDGTSPPTLHVYFKTQSTWHETQLDLLNGKVFWMEDKPVTAATFAHDLHHVEYSLYGEGGRLLPNFRSDIITDIRAGRTAGLSARNGWLHATVLVDGEPYDISHSGAILDREGHVFYFRQNGAERILYRDRQPVFRFSGFYSKPLEVSPDGTFYFIGNTDYGSSLYAYKDQEITRVLASDTVVDARWISDGEFLVAEVGADGHAIRKAKAERRPQLPAVYSYALPNENVVPEAAADPEQVRADTKEYNALLETRHSATNLWTGWSSSNGFSLGAEALFVDPLQYHAVGLGFAGSISRDQEALVEYTFLKYLPDVFVRYYYEREYGEHDESLGVPEEFSYDHEIALGVSLPLLRWRRWDARVATALTYESEGRRRYWWRSGTGPETGGRIRPDPEETYGLESQVHISYMVPTTLGFFPWRHFELSFFHDIDTLANTWTKNHNTSMVQGLFRQGFAREFYGALSGEVAWAETRDVEVDYNPYSISDEIRVPLLTSHNSYVVKSASFARFEAHKVFTTPVYSARIPVGLNRVAPFVVAQGVALEDGEHGFGREPTPANIFEWGYGVDMELLVLHRFPTQLRILNAYNTRNPYQIESELRLALKREF
ncbi:MAG: hypothetical protein AB7G93_08880 [Bdellovibrionales bacterium]